MKAQPIVCTACGIVIGILLTSIVVTAAGGDSSSGFSVEQLRLLTEVATKLKSDYVEPLNNEQLMNSCLNGMVTGFDPDSEYLDPTAFKELVRTGSEEKGGVGIEAGMEDGFVKVVAPVDDSPAARGGVKPGDYILKIDGARVKGLSLQAAMSMLRGKPNTQVELTIMRRGENKLQLITLTREAIRVASVKAKLIGPGFAYVRITQFTERTGAQLSQKLSEMYSAGRLQGLVLDLRSNAGGLFESAVAISAAFLEPNAVIVRTKGRTEAVSQLYTAKLDEVKPQSNTPGKAGGLIGERLKGANKPWAAQGGYTPNFIWS